MDRKGPAPIKEALGAALERITKNRQGGHFKEEVDMAWLAAAGEEASRHSAPAGFKEGELLVDVDSPIWIYQLNNRRKELEQKIAKTLKRKGTIRIRLRAGDVRCQGI